MNICDFDVTYRRNLTKDEQVALDNLRSYDDIIIKQADKGSAVVIMDKKEYLREAMRQLDDKEVYQPLVKDPTKDMIKKLIQGFKNHLKRGTLTEVPKNTFRLQGKRKQDDFICCPKFTKRVALDDQ